jgi:hypothetical protein
MNILSPAPFRTPPTNGTPLFQREWQSWFSELRDKLLTVETVSGSDLATHAAKTGTAVHGLGTASTRSYTDFDAAGTAIATQNTHIALLHDGILRLTPQATHPTAVSGKKLAYVITGNDDSLFIRHPTGEIRKMAIGYISENSWDHTISYVPGNITELGGIDYLCFLPTSSVIPGTDTTYWKLGKLISSWSGYDVPADDTGGNDIVDAQYQDHRFCKYFEIPYNSNMNFKTTDYFLMEFDFERVTGAAGAGNITYLGKGTARWGFEIGYDSGDYITITNGTDLSQSYLLTIDVAVKMNFKLIYNSGNIEFYIDNVKQVPESYTNIPFLTTEEPFILEDFNRDYTHLISNFKIAGMIL